MLLSSVERVCNNDSFFFRGECYDTKKKDYDNETFEVDREISTAYYEYSSGYEVG